MDWTEKANRIDAYAILGVSETAPLDEIKKCYRALALKFHPDKHEAESKEEKNRCEEKFKQIGEAWLILSDYVSRMDYDEARKNVQAGKISQDQNDQIAKEERKCREADLLWQAREKARVEAAAKQVRREAEAAENVRQEAVQASAERMAIAGRTYEILGILRGDEMETTGAEMLSRSKRLRADTGEDVGRLILRNQEYIPRYFQGNVVFVFPAWRNPDVEEDIACIYWDDQCWVQDWFWFDNPWHGYDRLLRRKN